MTSVSIIDYGIGNLLSVVRAFECFNININVVKTPEEIMTAERLVLPGVGAFSDGMRNLKNMDLIEPIKLHTKQGKPFLGICLGMQMMMSKSHEFGQEQGLDLIAGEVIPIPCYGANGQKHKVPHVGWNELLYNKELFQWDNTILADTPEKSAVYFVHSYMAVPENPNKQMAYVLYNGLAISAIISHENMYGCQFHPEKSGVIGLQILKQFMSAKNATIVDPL